MDQIEDNIDNLDPDEAIVVVCHHGMRSAQIAQYLIQSGFTNIINLAGGFDAWAREIDPGDGAVLVFVLLRVGFKSPSVFR